jgi:hypothetical protein
MTLARTVVCPIPRSPPPAERCQTTIRHAGLRDAVGGGPHAGPASQLSDDEGGRGAASSWRQRAPRVTIWVSLR